MENLNCSIANPMNIFRTMVPNWGGGEDSLLYPYAQGARSKSQAGEGAAVI